jgi:hypothetical protein
VTGTGDLGGLARVLADALRALHLAYVAVFVAAPLLLSGAALLARRVRHPPPRGPAPPPPRAPTSSPAPPVTPDGTPPPAARARRALAVARAAHLGALAFATVQQVLGWPCPLSVAENALRGRPLADPLLPALEAAARDAWRAAPASLALVVALYLALSVVAHLAHRAPSLPSRRAADPAPDAAPRST